MIKKQITDRNDIKVLYVDYNNILSNPKDHIKKIYDFLDTPDIDLAKIQEVVDKKLYRQRRQ